MQKDKRYYSRLKAAEKASKKAERYQSTEDAKMNALREQFGLDRLTAAANGQNLPEQSTAQAPSMTSPQPAGHGEPTDCDVPWSSSIRPLGCVSVRP